MGLFGFGKKKEPAKKSDCCCGGNCNAETMEQAEQTKASGGVKVLGGGCAKCHELEENTRAALAEMGAQDAVELITDFSVIAAYGVMSTPALVVDGKVVSCGKVLQKKEIIQLMERARG